MKTVLIKNNFSAGELSPTLYTRTDIQQYSNGAKRLKNVIPLVEGGVRKRPGTLSYGERSGAIRLIPFIVNSSNAFLLILKNSSIAIYNPRTKQTVAELECLPSPRWFRRQGEFGEIPSDSLPSPRWFRR